MVNFILHIFYHNSKKENQLQHRYNYDCDVKKCMKTGKRTKKYYVQLMRLSAENASVFFHIVYVFQLISKLSSILVFMCTCAHTDLKLCTNL